MEWVYVNGGEDLATTDGRFRVVTESFGSVAVDERAETTSGLLRTVEAAVEWCEKRNDEDAHEHPRAEQEDQGHE